MVGRCLGVGATRGVGVGLGVAVGVDVGVPEGVGDGEGEGVGVPPWPCISKEPMSMRAFATRSKPGPRWSKKGGGVKLGSPALIAGLFGNSAWVNVGPPLSWSGPSVGSVLI